MPAYNPAYSRATAPPNPQNPPQGFNQAGPSNLSNPPKKYTKINGIMKLNPEFKKWKEAQSGGQPATTVTHVEALPIISNMEDHEKMSEANVASGGGEIPLAESTNATIEMMQEPEISVGAGMQPDEMVDKLGAIMGKYEVPMGLMNKLIMLSEYNVLEFMVDDSGSMQMASDTIGKDGRPQTRWQEAQRRLKEMMEILGYVTFNEIHVCFLNRPERLILKRNGRSPEAFLDQTYRQIDAVFTNGPRGTTPFKERLRESLQKFGPHHSVARYFLGDGVPNGGDAAKDEIIRMLMNRPNAQGNPMTFLSCTSEDDQVEWMKEAEEVIPFCSEYDDFQDESREVIKDQGKALPFSFGFYLICALVGASNPDDLDAMDESVPFTKTTLDNLLGIQNNEESYRHYFNHFIQAQRERNGPTRIDKIKKNMNWQSMYNDFLRAPHSNLIPMVQQYKNQIKQ